MKEFTWITRVLGLEDIIKQQFPTLDLPKHEFHIMVTRGSSVEFLGTDGEPTLSDGIGLHFILSPDNYTDLRLSNTLRLTFSYLPETRQVIIHWTNLTNGRVLTSCVNELKKCLDMVNSTKDIFCFHHNLYLYEIAKSFFAIRDVNEISFKRLNGDKYAPSTIGMLVCAKNTSLDEPIISTFALTFDLKHPSGAQLSQPYFLQTNDKYAIDIACSSFQSNLKLTEPFMSIQPTFAEKPAETEVPSVANRTNFLLSKAIKVRDDLVLQFNLCSDLSLSLLKVELVVLSMEEISLRLRSHKRIILSTVLFVSRDGKEVIVDDVNTFHDEGFFEDGEDILTPAIIIHEINTILEHT